MKGTDEANAVFSDDEQYRYRLTRRWGPGPTVMFLMLNPSTATHEVLDPTVTRCLNYAKRWGAGCLVVGNIFALRSTDPKALYSHSDPVGPDNDKMLWQTHIRADRTVAAWGTHGALRGRGDEVHRLLAPQRPLETLRMTKGGFPSHPLYLPSNLEPVPYPLWPTVVA